MRIFIQALVLFAAPMAAYATVDIPEPETLSLLGIGAVAMLLTTMRRKK
jgi:hypothetical protein